MEKPTGRIDFLEHVYNNADDNQYDLPIATSNTHHMTPEEIAQLEWKHNVGNKVHEMVTVNKPMGNGPTEKYGTIIEGSVRSGKSNHLKSVASVINPTGSTTGTVSSVLKQVITEIEEDLADVKMYNKEFEVFVNRQNKKYPSNRRPAKVKRKRKVKQNGKRK